MTASNDLSDFLRRRDRLGLAWRGAHFVGFAMTDQNGALTLAVGSITCVTDGIGPPAIPTGRFVDTHDAVALSLRLEESDFPDLLEELARDQLPQKLATAFGRPVSLPFRVVDKPAGWYVDFRARYGTVPRVYSQRNSGGELYKVFGYDCIERARSVLLSTTHGPAFDGLADLAAQLPLENRQDYNNSSSRPLFEVVAQVPIRMMGFRYDKVARGYRVDLEVGRSVDRAAGLVSVAPGPRTHMTFAEFEEVRERGGVTAVRAVFPGPQLNEKINAAVIYREDILFEAAVEPRSQLRFAGAPPGGDEWTRTLEEMFDRSAREIQAQIRTLAGRARAPVLERMREAVEFLATRPFYSIVATASIVEALLRVRLRRYGLSRANQRLLATGAKPLSRSPGRLHLAEAIDAAQTLGIIARLDSHAATVMRESRNFVHIELGAKGHPRYSEAEAIEAFLAMLRVIDSLTRRRGPARPKRTSKRATR